MALCCGPLICSSWFAQSQFCGRTNTQTECSYVDINVVFNLVWNGLLGKSASSIDHLILLKLLMQLCDLYSFFMIKDCFCICKSCCRSGLVMYWLTWYKVSIAGPKHQLNKGYLKNVILSRCEGWGILNIDLAGRTDFRTAKSVAPRYGSPYATISNLCRSCSSRFIREITKISSSCCFPCQCLILHCLGGELA